MKKLTLTILFVIVSVAVVMLSQTWLIDQSNQKILQTLHDAGIKAHSIGETSLGLGAVEFRDIQFGEEGFGHIESIMQYRNWFKSFFSQSSDSTEFSKITINALPDDFSIFALPRAVNELQNGIMTLNDLNVNIAEFNISTKIGDLRIESKLSSQNTENGQKSIQSVTWAQQYQLGFQLPLSGIIQPDGSYVFESAFNDGKFNTGPIRLSRMNGWMSLQGEQGVLNTAALQLDIGSADAFHLPLQNINAAYSQSTKTANALLRGNITGLPDTKIALDYNKTPESEQGTLFIDLPSKEDAKGFWSRLLEKTEKSEALLSRLNKSGLSLSLTYQPDRRFAAGPIPFSVLIKDLSGDTDRPILQGNILIYTDSLTVKGSLFGDSGAIRDIQTLFDIPNERNEGLENLRFDASFSDFLKHSLTKR